MAIETEIKVIIPDLPDMLKKIRALRPKIAKERHFEDNIIFDYPDEVLKSKGCSLRVRFLLEGSYVTFKGPAKVDSKFKVKEEWETIVHDGNVLRTILEKLGLVPSFKYQKYRTEYLIPVDGEKVSAMIDETPMGNFLELEGNEAGILRAASALGFPESTFLKSTYLTLYKNYCELNNLPFGDMVFVSNRT